MHRPTVRDLAEPFALAMAHKARTLASLELTKTQAAALSKSMSEDVRKFHDAVLPGLMPYEISEAAAAVAAERGIDLAVLTYGAQSKADPRRELFHYEHMVTISTIVAKARELADAESIIDLLCSSRVAWITKAENDQLTRLGYNSRRGDPDAAYAEAGIRLVPLASASDEPDGP